MIVSFLVVGGFIGFITALQAKTVRNRPRRRRLRRLRRQPRLKYNNRVKCLLNSVDNIG